MKNVEIPKWLEGLPLAPEFRPTDTEFADPIAYISKIEEEASAFGICKIIPPLPKPSRKFVLYNLNRSLSKSPELGSDVNSVTLRKPENGDNEGCSGSVSDGAVFTTRHQELGVEKGKRVRGAVGEQLSGAKRQVWQSGEVYTLDQFEGKAKSFAKSVFGVVKEPNPLAVESMFWKAASSKPIYVEYANDVPGSGFAEPEGSLRHLHRHRRRRKRKAFNRNSIASSDVQNSQVDGVNNYSTDKDLDSKKGPNVSAERASSSTPFPQSHQDVSSSGRKDLNYRVEMEGTAGWKLSNSPWNLQVIARSAGSLTRFMPDDIPGVTSPMVYIGMLFSWFAWHVEDHELHSLNFLHMGSAKTWYAVPGDYAFNFEEVIRLQAYGGNTDRLAALSLLGEKTTVLSPEVVVGSGIPCCRLVQNPGEFVVTFPRAYHIGFSHGFNCGEAANFGTPKWLSVAKQAAVRRAAMNFLPMLSHQQLLHLLTMSFISRIPRSLLPGVRSSRLRDRQREEREYLVKKAFIEDILNENILLTSLLQRSSSYHVVMWNLELLPSSSKESICCNGAVAALSASGEKHHHKDSNNQWDSCIDAVDFDLDDYTLAYDFQIDSGTLPCVACGILGFPFMVVVQPSDDAWKTLLSEGDGNNQDCKVLKPARFDSLLDANHTDSTSENIRLDKDPNQQNDAVFLAESSQPPNAPVNQSSVSDHCLSLKYKEVFLKGDVASGWNIFSDFVRPRIFCLEHAIEIEALLQSKGGARILVICHSDFQKVKAHAVAVAEEISCAFSYNEISLNNASQGDLNLIDIAIDSEGLAENEEDWTSELSINLRHCIKVKKNLPSKKIQHLLTLSGLFSDTTPSSNCSNFKWQSRKSRSRRQLKLPSKSKPSDISKLSDNTVTVEEVLRSNTEHETARKETKLIQYSRKRYKSGRLSGATKAPADDPGVHDVLANNHVKPDLEATRLMKSAENVGTQSRICSSDELIVTDEVHNLISHGSEVMIPIKEVDGNSVENDRCSKDLSALSCNAETERSQSENLSGSAVGAQSDQETGSLTEKQSMMNVETERNTCDSMTVNGFDKPCDIREDFRHTDSSNSSSEKLVSRCDEQTEKIVADQIANEVEVLDSLSCALQKVQADGCNQERADLTGTQPAEKSTSLSTEELHSPNEEELNGSNSSIVQSESISKTGSKRKRELGLGAKDGLHVGGYSISPCEGLRPRIRKDASGSKSKDKEPVHEKVLTVKKVRKNIDDSLPGKDKKVNQMCSYKCDLEGCRMSFRTNSELGMHKRNQCPIQGCRKKFSSHKYAVQHQRVHADERPLKCPWKDCTMSFKWAWARTEHIRVHTGERPYVCKVEGCGLTFRFVSDFSRHRRKSGHHVNVPS